jgi:uncharacterized protein YbjQ (UPF0145 family)
MQAEAEAVQAEGIVGVQLSERSHGWGSHVIAAPTTVLDLS